MVFPIDREASLGGVNKEIVDDLDQQIDESQQCLEELWQRTQESLVSEKSSLIDAYRELSHKLEQLQVVAEDLRQQHKSSLTTCQTVEQLVEERITQLEGQVTERTVQLEQSLNFEAMLKRITDKVRDSLDESQILQTAVQELTLVLGVEGCDTAKYDAEQTTATISHEYTASLPSALGQVLQMAEFLEGYSQLLGGQYFQFCPLMPAFRGSVASLACPIFDNQGVLGDLWLFKQRDDAFNDWEIQLVQMVASQCAIAIRQARLYQAAQAQVAELEKLNRLKDDFLSSVSHELRTPVANMKMAIQMLAIALNGEHGLVAELSKPPTQRSKVARYFHILHNECDREINLINDLLDLQKLDTGKQALVLTTIHLQEWLPQIVEPYEERAAERQCCLQTNIEPDLPPFVCDHVSLGRIISELLDNACKYTPLGEKISVNARTFPGKMELSVGNSGVEIPTGERKQIFEKFYRIPSTDPWKQGGTGLGLALVEKLVRHLGGTIQLTSENNHTNFSMVLPMKCQKTKS